MDVLIWQGMSGNGQRVFMTKIRISILCAAARGMIYLLTAGALSATGTSRVLGTVALGFVVPGLNTLFFYPFTPFNKNTAKKGRGIKKDVVPHSLLPCELPLFPLLPLFYLECHHGKTQKDTEFIIMNNNSFSVSFRVFCGSLFY